MTKFISDLDDNTAKGFHVCWLWVTVG